MGFGFKIRFYIGKIGGIARNPEHCGMKWEGNVRKMSSRVDEVGNVSYSWSGKDICDDMPAFSLNEWLGRHVQIAFEGSIHCVVTGASIAKTFGEGMSYRAFMESPLACPSIIRPELSRIHEGIAQEPCPASALVNNAAIHTAGAAQERPHGRLFKCWFRGRRRGGAEGSGRVEEGLCTC